jgi:hypothetical protein
VLLIFFLEEWLVSSFLIISAAHHTVLLVEFAFAQSAFIISQIIKIAKPILVDYIILYGLLRAQEIKFRCLLLNTSIVSTSSY